MPVTMTKCPIKQGVCPREVKKMQCFYVTGTMSKCPIEQGFCTREVKDANFVCGWDHIKQGVCPRDIKNVAFVYHWEFA